MCLTRCNFILFVFLPFSDKLKSTKIIQQAKVPEVPEKDDFSIEMKKRIRKPMKRTGMGSLEEDEGPQVVNT